MRAVAATQIEARLSERLVGLDQAGLRRSLRSPSGIDLSSNDYLGLARHPEIQRRMAEAVLRDGCGSTGSRLLRGEREAFSEVERRFAQFKGTDRSIYFSSGYLANIAVLSTLPEAGDIIFSDERNHASLIDGIRLSKARRVVYPHNGLTALRSALQSSSQDGRKFVVTESLFSMDGDFAPLPELAELCREFDAGLIVDEAHAVGVYGPSGSGYIEEIGIDDWVLLSINSAGKALGVSGAFVAGSDVVVEALLQFARPFIFSTAATPAVADAILASLDVMAAEPWRRTRLRERCRYLRSALGLEGDAQIVPVIIGENDAAVAAATALQAYGFDVRAVRPPTVPPGTARLRVSLNVGLDEATLDEFVRRLRPCLVGCS